MPMSHFSLFKLDLRLSSCSVSVRFFKITSQLQRPSVTLVIPRTPIFGLEDVEPFPVPKSPAMMQQTPSVKIPLKTTKQSRKHSHEERLRKENRGPTC